MFCIYCGKNIKDDSSFCPYCGRNQETKSLMFCHNCGNTIDKDSSFCPYCGNKQDCTKTRKKIVKGKWQFPLNRLISLFKNRFFIWFILWSIINCLLLYKASDAYSDYFNSTNVSPNHWSSSNDGIYPEDWFYPFRNIFSGIMGQDPIYVYDISEFFVYVFILPIVLTLIIYKRNTIFKTERTANTFYWIIWYVMIWLLIIFPMGLLDLAFLGFSFTIGGLVVATYAYNKINANLSK